MSKITLYTSQLSKDDKDTLRAIMSCYGVQMVATLRHTLLVLAPTELIEPFLTIVARDVVPAEATDAFALVA